VRLSIRHLTKYHYAATPGRVDLLLRLWPSQFAGQAAEFWNVQVNGTDVPRPQVTAIGDHQAHLHLGNGVTDLDILAEGIVSTDDRAGLVAHLAQDVPPPVFLRSTHLTETSAAIADFASGMDGGSRVERLHSLMAAVREKILYRSGSTTAKTTAAEAFAQGTGVCQDHAHIFIAGARAMQIPARYVVGYYMAGEEDGALHETHGWAEAYVDALGWVGFDVTNGICPDHHHVRLCAGFDAEDAAPIKGFAYGGANIGVDADVRIAKAASEDGFVMQGMQQQ
jgi:transglutaminase-like putative cysteine protease